MQVKATRKEILIGSLSLAITIVLCVFIIQYRSFIGQIANWGYLGCFIINVLSSGTFVIPGFGPIITFTLGGVLHPAIVGAVAGIGEAIGAAIAYFSGYSGRGFFRNWNNPLQVKISQILSRHGSKTVFLMASLINPLYYPFAAFMGMSRFRFTKFFLFTWAGRTLKNMVLAYLGYLGLRSILRLFGLSF
jgi:membrane protein DedA with SNARE-associated domain